MNTHSLNDYTTEQLLFELIERLDKPLPASVKVDYVEPIHQFCVGIGADHIADINVTVDDLIELRHRVIDGRSGHY